MVVNRVVVKRGVAEIESKRGAAVDEVNIVE